jgi:hypothetical protein
MDFSKKIDKFPISVNNQQCVGPCYQPGTPVIHPISLNLISAKDHPFCPTFEWYNEKTKEYQQTDVCTAPSDISQMQQEINLNLVVPMFHFSCEYFLKAYYNIYSFEGATDWVYNNSRAPINSQLRILNCAWKVFGSNVDIINDQLINFYSNLIKTIWMKNIYPKVSKFIYIDETNNNIYLKENDQKDSEKRQIEKINYFNKKFNTSQIIYKVLQIYIKENKDKWNEIDDHNYGIRKQYTNYVIDGVKETTK